MRDGISIFGSCVTRDAFEYSPELLSQLKTYVARQRIASAVSRPMQISFDDFELNSPFQKRIVFYDLTKCAFQLFHDDGSNVLIIDLIDERFNLGRYKNTFITLSSELFNSKLASFDKKWIKLHTVPISKNFITGDEYSIALRPLSSFIHEFCQRLLAIYPATHIIINEVYFTQKYRDAKGGTTSFGGDLIKIIQKTNRLYQYMYTCLKKELVQAHVIDISQHFLADEKHKWGLSCMHFEQGFYEKLVIEILSCLEKSITCGN